MRKSRPHNHGEGHIVIDELAQQSKFEGLSPVGKLVITLIVIVLTIIQKTYVWGVVLCISMSILTVLLGGIPWRKYRRILLIPMGFILVSGLAIGIEYAGVKTGIVGFPLGHGDRKSVV